MLEDAVAAYRSALQEYTIDGMPLQWAKTQNNLGGAWWKWASGQGRAREPMKA